MKTREKLHRLIELLADQNIIKKNYEINFLSTDKHIPDVSSNSLGYQLGMIKENLSSLCEYLDVEIHFVSRESHFEVRKKPTKENGEVK